MQLVDGIADYGFNLEKLNQLFEGNEFSYHLSSGYVGDDFSMGAGDSAIVCSDEYTKGIYDPTLQCGNASAAPLCSKVEDTIACCDTKPAEDYCIEPAACAVGDLGGRTGKVLISQGGMASGYWPNVACPTCINDFLLPTKPSNYATWASVVFHDADNSKVLCGSFVQVGESIEECHIGDTWTDGM